MCWRIRNRSASCSDVFSWGGHLACRSDGGQDARPTRRPGRDIVAGMSDAVPPSHEQLVAARDVLLALSRLPEPWPTNDPVLAELVRLAGRVVQRDRKQHRTDAKH